MPPENSDRPPLPSASTEWALTAILREARKLPPSKIPGEAIHRETTQNHSGGSLLFASRVMRIIRVAAGREATYRRQQPKLDPQHQERKQYHSDTHAALMPALTELAYQVVDGVNAHGKGYSGKFFVEPARPVPDNAGDEYQSALAIKTHPKEAQALITQGVGSFLFHSKYHGDPEKRSASIEFQPQKTELDIKPGDGFYPPPKVKSLSADPAKPMKLIWINGDSAEEAALARALNSARAAMLTFMEKFNPDAVEAYKKTPEAARPADARKKAPPAAREEPVVV